MDSDTRDALLALIDARETEAFRRLEETPEYRRLDEAQKKSWEELEALCSERGEEGRRLLRACEESEHARCAMELDAIYRQGLRDSFALFRWLDGTAEG